MNKLWAGTICGPYFAWRSSEPPSRPLAVLAPSPMRLAIKAYQTATAALPDCICTIILCRWLTMLSSHSAGIRVSGRRRTSPALVGVVSGAIGYQCLCKDDCARGSAHRTGAETDRSLSKAGSVRNLDIGQHYHVVKGRAHKDRNSFKIKYLSPDFDTVGKHSPLSDI